MDKKVQKDFNKMLKDKKDMPKTQIVTDEATITKYHGDKMFFAPPLAYDAIIKGIPKGKVLTTSHIRSYLARKNNANFTDPMTCGIFINIVAWASYQRNDNITPFWRVLKSDGELNDKFPEGAIFQKKMLEEEGFVIEQRGRKNLRFYVKDFEESLYSLE